MYYKKNTYSSYNNKFVLKFLNILELYPHHYKHIYIKFDMKTLKNFENIFKR